MAITLFQHNAQAYESAALMLSRTGKAAVIHPTGTGKSFIGFKLCEEHPHDTVCWLSPSEYIFKTQIDNLRETGAQPPENIRFFTYARLMNMSDAEIAAIAPDWMVLDEFHRAGAACWGQGVARLLGRFPDVPVLGLSATAVRYLDNQRDMADELFDGNVASEMTLGEAIARGILAAPTYVCALYSYQKELERYERRVARLANPAVRDSADTVLEALRRALDKADGLDVIFDRHMTERTGKYLIFTPNLEVMRECMSKVPEWFGKVDAAPHVYSVYSADPTASASFAAFKQDGDTAHLRLLFAIDALNEGVHVEDLSGVILLRPTVSPTVYKQQIGRALSAGKTNHPVIFDIVNNFESLYSIGTVEEELRAAITYYRFFGDGETVTERFQIIDEVRDCRTLFEQLEGTLTASWDVMFSHAKQYYEQHGNLDVPRRYKTPEGYSLGVWLQTQRQIRAGKEAGCLDEERVAKLDSLGMRWESVRDVSWEKHYRACKAYRERYGNLNIPGDYVTEDGIKLGIWIKNVRNYHRSGIKSSYFTPERERQLDALGMIWDQPNYVWERNYAAALAYYREHGNLEVPRGYIQDGVKLNIWLTELKETYRGKREGRQLSEEQIARLNELHIRWGSKADEAWQTGLTHAKEYAREHGGLNVPYAYTSPDGYKLGVWLSKCREKHGKGTLSAERTAASEALGVVWSNARRNDWEVCYAQAQVYYCEHGDLRIPGDYVTEDGVWLGKWLNEQKQILRGKRKGKTLSAEQKSKLEQIGFTPDSAHKDQWDKRYAVIKDWYDEHGNLDIPVGYTDEYGQKPSAWLSRQRGCLKAGRLDSRQVGLLRQVGVWA